MAFPLETRKEKEASKGELKDNSYEENQQDVKEQESPHPDPEGSAQTKAF